MADPHDFSDPYLALRLGTAHPVLFRACAGCGALAFPSQLAAPETCPGHLSKAQVRAWIEAVAQRPRGPGSWYGMEPGEKLVRCG